MPLRADTNETARLEHLRFKDTNEPLSPGFLAASRHSLFSSTFEAGRNKTSGPEQDGALTPRNGQVRHAAGAARLQCTSDSTKCTGNSTVQRLKPHPDPLHFTDPRCGEDGLPSTYPGSRCFESLHNFSRELQRGNVLRGCHLCLAALGLDKAEL